MLPDPLVGASHAERVILVSGKLYYDLVKEREARGLCERVAIVRIEELCPFPFEELQEVLRGVKGDVRWVQEEPRNQGAWTHVYPRAAQIFKKPLEYHGRDEDAVPAPGVGYLYRKQQEMVIRRCLRWAVKYIPGPPSTFKSSSRQCGGWWNRP